MHCVALLSRRMRSITLEPMTCVAIVAKPNREELKRLLPELIAWLRQHGYEPVLDREGGSYTAAAHELAIKRVAECVRSLGWQAVETIPSPITGAEGNQEFLLYAKRGKLSA